MENDNPTDHELNRAKQKREGSDKKMAEGENPQKTRSIFNISLN